MVSITISKAEFHTRVARAEEADITEGGIVHLMKDAKRLYNAGKLRKIGSLNEVA